MHNALASAAATICWCGSCSKFEQTEGHDFEVQFTPARLQPIKYLSVGLRPACLQKQTFAISSVSTGTHHSASQGSAVAYAGRWLNTSDHAIALLLIDDQVYVHKRMPDTYDLYRN